MVVEIDPRDVVSVPLDCDQQTPTAKYKVVATLKRSWKNQCAMITVITMKNLPMIRMMMDSMPVTRRQSRTVKLAQKRDANGRFTKA